MIKTRILLSALFLAFNLLAASQKKSLYFDILINGNKVGKVVFTQSSFEGTDSLRLESSVKTNLVLAVIVAEAMETAVFNDGILKESFIYRQMNGKEKANKKHRADNGKYVITNGSKSSTLDIYPITYNMLCLYTKEPVSTRKVYSDNFESAVEIEKIEAHKYKVTLPDKNYNYYNYKNGVLNQVEIHHTLYSAKLVLVTK